MKKQIRSMTAITWLLILSIMGTWLLSMISLTVVTAQEIYDTLYRESDEFSSYVRRCSKLDDYYEKDGFLYGKQDERADEIEYNMLWATMANTRKSVYSNQYYGNTMDVNESTEDRSKLIREVFYPMETAVLFYDRDGRLLHSTDEDIMFFRYYTEKEWKEEKGSTASSHYGWLDLSAESEAGMYDLFRNREAGTGPLYMDYPLMRLTGTFHENEFKPAAFYYTTERIGDYVFDEEELSDVYDGYSNQYSEVDQPDQLKWNMLFDNVEAHTGENLITIYINDADNWDKKGNPVRYKGEEYESLVKLTESLNLPISEKFYYDQDFREAGIYELNNLIVFTAHTFGDYESGEKEYILVTAIKSNPLLGGMDALRNIYIVTGLIAIGVLLLVRSSIRKQLIEPVGNAAKVMEEGWKGLYLPKGTSDMWEEAAKTSEEIKEEINYRRMKENETARLEKALNYAQTAEENRRKMTSAVAHELKTPIAIIHSYAEGLKEHIAEDKRDQYVEVILSETERIDGMVLEMLDLSRLEAGKIKLSRDEFSMKELTESVFAKLERAAKAKNLKISFEIPDLFIVIADENRIGQVIENFATNAIKYTKPGGKVDVQIWKERSKTVFAIENESEPLSDQALSKVWETFYRADESRQGTGTGLGLAIAKNIVELHGGECFVRNTKGGVEFKFRI